MCVCFVGFFVHLVFWLVGFGFYCFVCVCGEVCLFFFPSKHQLCFSCVPFHFFLSFSASFLTSLVKQLLKKLNDPNKTEPRLRIFLTD